jgi:hypothetical protein
VGAAEWQRYDNALFGYGIDLPASFAIEQQDDARLVLRAGAVTLEVFGLDLAPLGFEEATALAIKSSGDEGFAVIGRAVTARWAQWTGVDGARQLAAALVPLCGTALAGYELRFSEADGVAMQPVIDRLTASLKRTRDC